MDAVKFFKDVKKMCDQHDDTCKGCPLKNKNCYQTIKDVANPKEIVEAVEKWSKEHPKKTRQSEFLKMFPNATTELIDNCEVLVINPCQIERGYEKTEYCTITICNECLKNYWLAEVEE